MTKRLIFVSAFALFVTLHSGTARAWYPALEQEMPLPTVQVIDEHGHGISARDEFEALGSGPALLVPVFTKCQMSCPVLVGALKRAVDEFGKTNSGSLRVLIVSFDASDTAADLKTLREHEALPASWGLVRANDQASIRGFFDRYSYSVMDSEGGFAHPSQVFVLNRDLKWVGSILGPKITTLDIGDAFAKAWATEATGPLAPIRRLMQHPEALLLFGCFGFLASLSVALVFVFRRRPKYA